MGKPPPDVKERRIPAGAATCDVQTGEGCSTDQMPVTAQDQNGGTSCVCVYSC